MYIFTPVSNRLVTLSHINSTPIDRSAIKSFRFSKYPLIKIDIYEDNTWGINAPEIYFNCFNEEVLEPIFQWGDTTILYSIDCHVYVSSKVINLSCGGEALLSVRSDFVEGV
jgi:hypothetical protein